MASFYGPPPTVTAKALATVDKELWSKKETEWLPGIFLSYHRLFNTPANPSF
jgi:hypothetical protein